VFSKIFVLAQEGISPNWWRNMYGNEIISGDTQLLQVRGLQVQNIVISDTKKPSQQIIN
jgi:hypothetical protein